MIGLLPSSNSMEAFLDGLGDEITDANEETFYLFSLPQPPAQALGIVSTSSDGKGRSSGNASSFNSHNNKNNNNNILNLLIPTIAGTNLEFEIHPSPALLHSRRAGGTTGAAVWEASLRLAEWIAWEGNPLFGPSFSSSSSPGVLSPESIALELGSGVAGIVPCVLAPRVRRVVATDQEYILKALQANLERNGFAAPVAVVPTSAKRASNKQSSGGTNTTAATRQQQQPGSSRTNNNPIVEVLSLDWETDDVAAVLYNIPGLGPSGVDLLFASDCIYNYALIAPFVQTCAEIATVRRKSIASSTTSEGSEIARSQLQPTLCLIAQQLRQPEVFEEWLEAFLKVFRVWRVPEECVMQGLKEGSGFVVHLGILR